MIKTYGCMCEKHLNIDPTDRPCNDCKHADDSLEPIDIIFPCEDFNTCKEYNDWPQKGYEVWKCKACQFDFSSLFDCCRHIEALIKNGDKKHIETFSEQPEKVSLT